MNASSSLNAANWRLNPFAFPSDTTSRFVLLLVFAIAAAALVWSSIAMLGLGLVTGFADCWPGWEAIGEAIGNAIQHPEQTSDPGQCYRPLNRQILPAMGIGVALLAILTFAIWWLHPNWLAWRMRLSKLRKEEAPELVSALEQICTIAGLRRPPDFYWNPLGMAPLALAYGRAGRYRLALTGAMAVRFTSDPPVFRAVILHELAHIANRDIDKTWLAVGAWWALILSALLPRVALQLWLTFSWVDVAASAVQAATITGLVFITRNAMLRARELYADARASVWMSDAAGMAEALSGLRPIRGLHRLISPHPDPAHRLRLLHATDVLFHAGFWDLLGIGAAASLGAGILFIVVSSVGNVLRIDPPWGMLLQLFSPAAAVAPLTAIAAATMIWRASFSSLMRGLQPRGAVRGGIALGLGIVLGSLVYTAGGLPVWAAEGGPAFPAPVIVATVLWTVLGFLPPVVFLKWVEAAAMAWIPIALRRQRPGPGFKVVVGLNCMMVVPWFALAGPIAMLLVVLWLFMPAFLYPLIYSITTIFPLNVIASISAAAIWGFPLAAWLWRRPETRGVAGWAFLEPPHQTLPHPTLPLQPGLSIAIGLVAGFVAGALLRWVQVPFAPTEQMGVQATEVTELFVSMMLTAILVQALVAALTVFAVASLTVIHAMFAAFVAGNVLSLAVCAHMTVLDPSLEMALLCLRLGYGAIVMGGAAAALPLALIAWTVKAGLSRVRPRPSLVALES